VHVKTIWQIVFFCADIWRNSCIIKRPSLLIANGPPTSLSIMLRQVPALFGGIHLPLLSSRRRLLACRLSVGLPATEGRLLAAATHRVLQTANASQCALYIYIHTNLYIPVNRRRRAFSHGKNTLVPLRYLSVQPCTAELYADLTPCSSGRYVVRHVSYRQLVCHWPYKPLTTLLNGASHKLPYRT